jgi:hypothetical protein
VTDGRHTAGAGTNATVQEGLLPDGTRGDANQRFLSEVYHDLLYRPLDLLALRVWGGMLQAGADRAAVVQAIMNAAPAGASGPDAVGEYRKVQVELLYEQYLPGHEVFDLQTRQVVDPVAVQAWGGLLQAGATVEQVAARTVSTPEFLNGPAQGTALGFLRVLYRDTFARDLDPAGQAAYGAQLAAGGDLSQPTGSDLANAVALEVFTSPEYVQDLVGHYYSGFLDRQPAPIDNVGVWQGELAGGMRDEVVLAQFVGGNQASHEFFDKTAD